jgi:hypothetical protein
MALATPSACPDLDQPLRIVRDPLIISLQAQPCPTRGMHTYTHIGIGLALAMLRSHPMNAKTLVIASLVAAAATACAAQSQDESAAGGEGALTEGDTLVCDGLGTNAQALIQVKGDKATVTVQGSSVQTGSKQADPKTGFTAYANWVPANGFMKDAALWLSNDNATAELHEANVGPFYNSHCHKGTSGELGADACLPLIRVLAFIDSTKAPAIKKLSETSYAATYPDARVGDFVWHVAVHKSGLLCTLGKETPASCAAAVADAIGRKARDDGSSAGEPYVNKLGSDTWNGGIHDPESGEFAYDVETSSDSSNCTVKSITAKK